MPEKPLLGFEHVLTVWLTGRLFLAAFLGGVAAAFPQQLLPPEPGPFWWQAAVAD